MVLLTESKNSFIRSLQNRLNYLQYENKYYTFIEVDIESDESENLTNSTLIFYQDPYKDTHDDYIEKLSKSLAFCKDMYATLIYIDTPHVYGLTEYTSVDERHLHKPHSSIGKIREEAYQLLIQQKGVNIIMLRYPDLIGHGCNIFFDKFFEGKSNFFKWHGLTSINHEFMYMEDALDIISYTVLSPRFKDKFYPDETHPPIFREYNISGDKYTIEQMAAKINEMFGINIKVHQLSPTLLLLQSFSNYTSKAILENSYLNKKPVFLNASKWQTELSKIHNSDLEDILKGLLDKKD